MCSGPGQRLGLLGPRGEDWDWMRESEEGEARGLGLTQQGGARA